MRRLSAMPGRIPPEGMQKSHEEILHILALMHMPALKNQVFQGAEAYLPDEFTPVHSPLLRT